MNDYQPPTVTDITCLTIYPTQAYPPEWVTGIIPKLIKDIAGWQCEHCNHPHDTPSGHVLTVHHINMLKHDCRWQNLVALCQRCHLHLQASYNPSQPRLIGDCPIWAAVRGLP
jgi:hypothetical protein